MLFACGAHCLSLQTPEHKGEIELREDQTFQEALSAANTLPESHHPVPPASFPEAFTKWVMGPELFMDGEDALVGVIRDELLFNTEGGVRAMHYAHVLRVLSKLAGEPGWV
jgi:hypothetical protein